MAKYARVAKEVFRIATDTNRYHSSAVVVMESSVFTASVRCKLLAAVVLFFFLSFTLTFASFGQHNRMRQALWISKYSPMELNSYLIYPSVCFYVLISCTLWYKQQNQFWLVSTLSKWTTAHDNWPKRTHHIENANELKIKRDRHRSGPWEPGVTVFVVSVEEVSVQTCFIHLNSAIYNDKDSR